MKIEAPKKFKNQTLTSVILVMIQFLVVLDFVIMMPLGPIFLRELNIDAKSFGLIVSSYNISAGLFGLVGALYLDRFDRKTTLLVTFFGFTVGTVFCGIGTNLHSLILARIFTGVFGGVLMSIILAIVGDLYPREIRGEITGMIMAAFPLSTIMGIPVGLWLAAKFGYGYPFIFIAALSVIPLIGAYFLFPNVKVNKSLTTKESLKQVINFFKIKNNLYIFTAVFSFTVSGFLLFPYVSTYMVTNMGLKESDLGLIYMVSGFLTFFTSRYFGKLTDRHRPFHVLMVLALLAIIPMILITHLGHTNFYIVMIINSFFMILMAGRFIPFMTMANSAVLSHQRGSFLSIVSSLRNLGSSVGSFIGGLIVVTKSNMTLENVNYNSYLSISIVFVILYLTSKIETDVG